MHFISWQINSRYVKKKLVGNKHPWHIINEVIRIILSNYCY